MRADDARHQRARARRARLAQATAVALSVLLCSKTVAQSVAPAEVAPPEAASAAAPVAAQSAPAPAEVARAALNADQRSVLELRQLQLRENEAWSVRSEISLAWPAVGLGIGSVLAPIMVPLGSVLVATADHAYESYTESNGTTEITGDHRERQRRAGSVLLAIGLAAVVSVVYCGVLVRRRRHAKRLANEELVAVRMERTLLLQALTPPGEPSGRAD